MKRHRFKNLRIVAVLYCILLVIPLHAPIHVSSIEQEIILGEIVQSEDQLEYDLPNIEGLGYGVLLDWKEIDHLIPDESVFRVSDVDSGLSFYVQRRAGRKHADVQPLTYDDTRIMKEIYNGTWSWERRAIIIQLNNYKIAASMHGMPHGGGALKNGFPGHFCIHFKGSTTHKTKKVDHTHQVMVYKAAGKTHSYLSQIEPSEMIDVFIMAVNQKDQQLMRLLLTKEDIFPLNKNQQITYMTKILTYPTIEEGFLNEEIQCTLNIYTKNRRERKQVIFSFNRNTIYDPWKITNITTHE